MKGRIILFVFLLYLIGGTGCNKAEQIQPDDLSGSVGSASGSSIATSEGVDVNNVAPDFTQDDMHGNLVRFSSFRENKYVLINFWASWDNLSKEETPALIEVFNRFKNRNFTILGVGIESDKEKWINAALVRPGMQVTDLKRTNNAAFKLYKLRTIPVNILVDPSGKIIAKGSGFNTTKQEWIDYLDRILPNTPN